MSKILIFGDSYAYGAWDREGGWANRLRKFYDKAGFGNNDYYEIFYQLGIDGETSKLLLERFELECRPRLSSTIEENVIIIEIGGNDSCFMESQQHRRVEKDEFENNLRQLADIAAKFSKKIIFIGTGAVLDESNPVYKTWVPDFTFTNAALREYDAIIKKVAKEKGVHYIDVSKKAEKYKSAGIFDSDGLHLNDKGHKLLFGLVKKYLIKNNILPDYRKAKIN